MRILIVDDEKISAQVLKKNVERFGDVTIAQNGEDAFDAFEKAHEAGTPIDLIFLDIMMPKVDGQETLAAIREYEEIAELPHGKRAKVVMVTGLSDGQNLYEAFRHQCDDYITKPIDPKSLRNIFNKLGLE